MVLDEILFDPPSQSHYPFSVLLTKHGNKKIINEDATILAKSGQCRYALDFERWSKDYFRIFKTSMDTNEL